MLLRTLFSLGSLLMVGCGSSSAPAADAAADASELPGIGCADGVRDGLVDLAMFPEIAACSGAWIIAGLDAPARTDPGCQTSGNDAPTSGVACSAANLCAPGWHICASAAEVASRLPSGSTCATEITTDDFFATNQGSVGSGICGDSGANDLFGCGGIGNNATASCAPLDVSSGNGCAAIASAGWSCGGASTMERATVVKPRSTGGGVLCCATL